MEEFMIKMVLLGDTAVGKTSLLLRYVDNAFTENYLNTLGVDFKIKTLEMADCVTKLILWDTAGQDRFRSIVSNYYRGSDCLVIVFDITQRESFKDVQFWLSEATRYTDDNCQRLIIGNKLDLRDQRVVTYDESKGFADSLNVPYIETSAKNATNVHQAFTCMTELIVKHKKSGMFPSYDGPPSIDFSAKDPQASSYCAYDTSYCTLV